MITILGSRFVTARFGLKRSPPVKKSLIPRSKSPPTAWGFLRGSPDVTAESFCVEHRVPFSVSACYSFCAITILFLIQGAFHGMDHTATRRDRPELRNQFLRQR